MISAAPVVAAGVAAGVDTAVGAGVAAAAGNAMLVAGGTVMLRKVRITSVVMVECVSASCRSGVEQVLPWMVNK